MNYEIREGKERLPEEEDVYGVNESEENEYDYEFWMPHEESCAAGKIYFAYLHSSLSSPF